MAKKYLPIQFFEKRKDFDDRSTEGGGILEYPVGYLQEHVYPNVLHS